VVPVEDYVGRSSGAVKANTSSNRSSWALFSLDSMCYISLSAAVGEDREERG
jgi:hypothetical protein